jgi:multidrug efflux pump subunit AcrB
MNLSAFALRYQPIVVTAVAILMAWGALSYATMPRREDPEYVVRTCQILTSWPGTSTEQVEELVTAPIEAEVNQLDGVRWVKSETSVGRSAIFVELDRATPGAAVPQMWDKVRSRVERVQLPEPGIKPLVIDDFGDTNVMVLGLYQIPLPGEDEVREENRYSPRDLEVFATRLKDELKLLAGVAKVDVSGVRKEAIYIETDLGTWAQLELTSSELQTLLSQRNVIAPGGTIDTASGRFFVMPSGDIDAEREIRSIVVDTTANDSAAAPVYLEDLGLSVVRDYEDPPTSITRFADPHSAVGCVLVSFSMKAGANIVDVCANAKDLIARLVDTDKIFPPDLALGIVSDQSETVERKIDAFMDNVIGAVLIVVVVVFLMVGLRSAIVMAANIPIVIIGSLALISFLGIQMEQISLAAMIIALGMLVDNAVQICDQARRLQGEGLSPYEAARRGAKQLSFPMLIATGTTIGAFFPMVIGLQGPTKEYIYSLPITITVVLGLSWVMAMTFCVVLAYWFIKAPEDPSASLSPAVRLVGFIREKLAISREAATADSDGGFMTLFAGFVRVSLRFRLVVVAVSLTLFVAATSLPVRTEFFPQDVRDQFTVDVWLPEGASIEQTEKAAEHVEHILRRLSEAEDASGATVERLRAMCTVIGRGAPRWYLGRTPEAPKPNFAEMVVRTTDGWITHGYVEDLRRVLNEGDAELGLEPVTTARVIPRELMLGPVVDAPIGLRIYGPRLGSGFADERVMREQASRLMAIVRDHPGTWDVYETWGSSSYRIDVDIDEDRANLAGVTNAAVAQTLSAYFNGQRLTTFREADHQVPVYLRLKASERGSLDDLHAAYVEGAAGKVPLDSVASIRSGWAPAKIERRFLQRAIEVRARVKEGYSANDVVLEIMDGERFRTWESEMPPGYRWEVGGSLFESSQSRSELMVAVLISALVIVLLLIIQYNGFAKPLIILTTVPLALIGALPGLYFTDNPLGFMPQLGLLSLFGIVVNTAIIFIEFAEGLIDERSRASSGSGPILGLTRNEFRECLVEAAKVRLLPIAMTTLTTVGGLLPLAIAGGPLWEGMAWLMISGLVVATLLTLVVVPALYAIFVEQFRMSPVGNAAISGSDRVSQS